MAIHRLRSEMLWFSGLRTGVRPPSAPPPLDTNFNTKLVSGFLRYLLCGYAEIKSYKVREGQNLQFMKAVASFQEIERFTVAIRGGFLMAHDRRL